MRTYFYQVPNDVYDDFIKFLSYSSLVFDKIKEVVGFSVVKCVGSSEECEAANNYLDKLIYDFYPWLEEVVKAVYVN